MFLGNFIAIPSRHACTHWRHTREGRDAWSRFYIWSVGEIIFRMTPQNSNWTCVARLTVNPDPVINIIPPRIRGSYRHPPPLSLTYSLINPPSSSPPHERINRLGTTLGMKLIIKMGDGVELSLMDNSSKRRLFSLVSSTLRADSFFLLENCNRRANNF